MSNAATFDLFVIGSGGGPYETNLSSFLLKTSNASWEDGILAIEAGSGIGALDALLRQNKSLFLRPNSKKRFSAAKVYSFIQSFLISHAHLDHVSALVLSAGALPGIPKRIYAIQEALVDLQRNIFTGRIWPQLARRDDEVNEYASLIYCTLNTTPEYAQVFPGISVRTFLLNHGRNRVGPYNSAAFLIRHDETQHEFLFFGDTEPDVTTSTNLLHSIWTSVAPKIGRSLHSIFIECSWPSGRKDNELYGHLTPEHLVSELQTLAREVKASRNEPNGSTSARHDVSSESDPVQSPHGTGHKEEDTTPSGSPGPTRKRRRLNSVLDEDTHNLRDTLIGLTVYITHCKDDMNLDASPDDPPMRNMIVEQITKLIQQQQLGATIVGVEPGMQFRV